jgi:BirA family biotin operon repressor/biotin-[acetyl-CoA-carboxylase] ligase
VGDEKLPNNVPNKVNFEVINLDSVDSTNRYIIDHLGVDAGEGLVVTARFQTGGRGRLERAWNSKPDSSLLVSVLFEPKLPPSQIHVLPSLSAVAMAEAIEDIYPIKVGLKWPNDLYVDEKKLGGILAESRVSKDSVKVIVGLGVNLDWSMEELEELHRPATAVSVEIGAKTQGPKSLLDRFLDKLASHYLHLYDKNGFIDETSYYRRRCITIGRLISVEMAEDSFEGVALDIAPTGELLVAIESCVRAVSAGDVIHIRPLAT